MTFIVRPDLDEDEARAVVDTVTGRLESAGGEILATVPWNPPRRRMAYPIRDFGDGFYITTVFKFDPQALRTVESQFRLNEDVLRFLIIQATEENVKQAQQRVQQAAVRSQPAPEPSAVPVATVPETMPQEAEAAPEDSPAADIQESEPVAAAAGDVASPPEE
jgi:small subunit ribosomal protein S6